MNRLLSCFVTLIVVFAVRLPGLDPSSSADSCIHRLWSSEHGLPTIAVNAITQTSDGYIWIGTLEGLSRFDGRTFSNFTSDNTKEFLSSSIYTLLAARDGSLWIGTVDGGLLCYRDRRFTRWTKREGLLDNEVRALWQTADGAVWIGTGQGVNVWRDGVLSGVPLPAEMTSRAVRCLLQDRLGNVWVGTRGGGLAMFRRNGAQWESEFRGWGGQSVYALLEARDGALWIGTAESGLYRVHAGRTRRFTAADGLPAANVRCLLEDRDGNVWVGSLGGGLAAFPVGSERLTVFDGGNVLNSRQIYAMFEDRDRNLWLGAYSCGLLALRDTHVTYYTRYQGLNEDRLCNVMQDRRGTMWATGDDCTISYLRNGRFHSLPTPRDGQMPTVKSLAEFPAGTMWFALYGRGVYRFRQGCFTLYDTRRGLPDPFPFTLYGSETGGLWLGTESGELLHYEDDRFQPVLSLGERINALLRDRRGSLWIGTYKRGVHRWRNGVDTVIGREMYDAPRKIMSLFEDCHGVLWIGTEGEGLYAWRDERLRRFTRRDGLPDNTCYGMLEDDKGHLWVSSNQGVFRLNRRNVRAVLDGGESRFTPLVLSYKDGVLSRECSGGYCPSCWRSRDGHLWFLTIRGICRIDPERIAFDRQPPPVLVDGVDGDGRSYVPRDSVIIAPGNGDVLVSFTSPTFIDPEAVRFHYYLHGHTRHWVEAGTARQAAFFNLCPGRYRFEVRASFGDDHFLYSSAAVTLHIRAKWYRCTWFLVLFPFVLAAGAGGVWLALRRRRARRRFRNRYTHSSLHPEEILGLQRKIQAAMEERRLYRNPLLTLALLAREIGAAPRQVSHVINEQYRTNFIDFLNGYRIREAQELLRDAQCRREQILEIAYRVGFNSKSVFNQAFKARCKMTPSEFRRRYDGVSPAAAARRGTGGMSLEDGEGPLSTARH